VRRLTERREASSAGPASLPRTWRRLILVIPLALSLTGCDKKKVARFGLPQPTTAQGHRILTLWTGAFWAALVVGAFVYVLILWACFRFRRRGDRLPRQVHYNVPVEVLYVAIPFVIIGVLFFYTARDESYLDKLSKKPDVRIGVVGFQWDWQFNYPDEKLQVTGRIGQDPVLVLPVNKQVQFIETSPDVIHSFWVPDFLFKRDVIPGRANRFEIRTEKAGTFEGRCAELCGVYHSRMLFKVKVVSDDAYQRFLTTAKAQAAAGTSDIYSTTSGGTASSAAAIGSAK
jgi:cytochrome c oxidase subunit 2